MKGSKREREREMTADEDLVIYRDKQHRVKGVSGEVFVCVCVCVRESER